MSWKNFREARRHIDVTSCQTFSCSRRHLGAVGGLELSALRGDQFARFGGPSAHARCSLIRRGHSVECQVGRHDTFCSRKRFQQPHKSEIDDERVNRLLNCLVRNIKSFAASLSAALAGRAFPVKRVCNFEKISISSIASFMRTLAALVWDFKIHCLQSIRGKLQQVRLSIALNKTVSVGIADHLWARPLSAAFCRWSNSASRLTGWPLPNWNMAVANSKASSNAAGCIVRSGRSTSAFNFVLGSSELRFLPTSETPLQYERVPGGPLRKKMTLTKGRRPDLSH